VRFTLLGAGFLAKDYWCLFCGQDGIRFDTPEEVFEHMKTTVHRDEKGGIVFYHPEEK